MAVIEGANHLGVSRWLLRLIRTCLVFRFPRYYVPIVWFNPEYLTKKRWGNAKH